jgi:general secretion pathway protein D
VVVAGSLYPSFFKRVVETTLTVEHGQTIVLGGLIRENRSKGNSGVPCLVRMPLLGPLFGQRRNALDKTELIILLTPKVIVNRDEIDAVTADFKARVESVVEGMKKMRDVPFSPLLDDVMNPDR